MRTRNVVLWLAGVSVLVLIACVGCDSDDEAGGLLAVAPADFSIAQGRMVGLSLTLDGVPVAADTWTTGDSAVATVVRNSDGAATLTGVGPGSTSVTGASGSQEASTTVTVEPEAIGAVNLTSLADYLEQLANDGAIGVDTPILPDHLPQDDDLAQALAADLGNPPRMVTLRLDPAVFDVDPVVITPDDLTLATASTQASVVTRGTATADATIKASLQTLITALSNAGCPMGLFQTALNQTSFHQEGNQAGGVTPRPGVPGVTFVNTLTYYNGFVILIYDGDYHTVFNTATATALRAGQIFDANGKLTEFASTALHELAHVVVDQNGFTNFSDEENSVSNLEEVVRRKANIALCRAKGVAIDPRDILNLSSQYQALLADPLGAGLLSDFQQQAPPTSVTITAPATVNPGQIFTATVTISGSSGPMVADLAFTAGGAAAPTGAQALQTGANGQATQQVTAPNNCGRISLVVTVLGARTTTPVEVIPATTPVVILDHDLHTSTASYFAGDCVELSRIENGVVAGVEPGCSAIHLHAASPMGIFIDADGPFPDPAPPNCGYGRVYNAQP